MFKILGMKNGYLLFGIQDSAETLSYLVLHKNMEESGTQFNLIPGTEKEV